MFLENMLSIGSSSTFTFKLDDKLAPFITQFMIFSLLENYFLFARLLQPENQLIRQYLGTDVICDQHRYMLLQL